MFSDGRELGGSTEFNSVVKDSQSPVLRDQRGLRDVGGGCANWYDRTTGRWSLPMSGPVVTVARVGGPFPRQRSKVEGFPEVGSILVGRPGGVMREIELLSARKLERDKPDRFLRLLGRAGSQKS